MLISRRLSVVAAHYVDRASATPPGADEPGRRPYAAIAAQAAMRACPFANDDLRGTYHAATVVPTIRALNLAAHVLTDAQLPVHHDDPVVTVAGSSHGLLTALRLAATELDATIDPTTNLRLVTAGDAWPAASVPESTLRDDAGGALVLSNEPGPLQLLAIVSETDLELARLVQTYGDRQLINERAQKLMAKLAVGAMHDAHIGEPEDHEFYVDKFIDHLVTPHLPGSKTHETLRRTIGARPNEVELLDTTGTGDTASSPLNLIRHLAAIVQQPHKLGHGATVLAVSDCDTGTASAAVFKVRC